MDSTKCNKRRKNQNPESNFQQNLNSCSKTKDLGGAISIYDGAVAANIRLHLHHFNSLLYLCSNSVTDPSSKDSALEYGFRVFDHLLSSGVTPNEATITAVARLAAAKGDGDRAFGLVKSMGEYRIIPRLRTYDPALFCFCENSEADKAYEVEEHMVAAGVIAEEAELAALLKVSAAAGRADRVYGYLHKLRSSVRCVRESTAEIVKEWFLSEKGSEIRGVDSDEARIEEAIARNGGGWHGLGFVGEGKWVVNRVDVECSGRCCSCDEQLVCVDIDVAETERFAQSVSGLALEREAKANFSEFQGWLEKHSDYEAIVDAANIGLYQQNFAEGGFSVTQLDAVVKELFNWSGGKWPLIVLHNKRLRSILENPSHRELVQEWMDQGILYTTPNGSNDDWYWLYAAVKLKCLLVTNDEMRDHIFELLGSSFFLQWKERHQVHYTFVKDNLKLQMPPPYSLVIQESGKGSWHVPIAGDKNEERKHTWLCISRISSSKKDPLHDGTSQNGNFPSLKHESLKPCKPQEVANCNTNGGVIGKRKDRSPSPSGR